MQLRSGYMNGCMRIRAVNEKRFFLAVKSGDGLTRRALEVELPRDVFDLLWSQTEGSRVEKTRYSVPFITRVLEVERYDGALAGLWMLRCEFKSEHDARRFTLPSWAASAVEVTDDPAWQSATLATSGRRSDEPVPVPELHAVGA